MALFSDIRRSPCGKFSELLIVLAGIFLGQAILYGPSLIGSKILLPLDMLASPGIYLPQIDGFAGMEPHDQTQVDLIDQFEPARQFAVSQIDQGRFPVWTPNNFAGVPFPWPKFSPFLLLQYCVKSPVILAWAQLLAAMASGAGMYFFCRRALRTGFWPATVAAWCYPLTAFFILWQGTSMELTIFWLPWLFLAVDRTVRGHSSFSIVGLAAATFLILNSRNIDVAGQALLGALLFAAWCLWDLPAGANDPKKAGVIVGKLAAGWALGFLLAAPHVLPLVEYAHSGSRMAQRSQGLEERPPVGLAALPQAVMPDIYGSPEKGSCFIVAGTEPNLIESPSAAYAGILAALLVAPLAWSHRPRRGANNFWLIIAVLGLSWCVDVPGVVQLLRLPGLNMMSYNRLVFLTAFAILCLAAVGLENIVTGVVRRRWWFWPPAILLAGLCLWCFYRSRFLPEPVATEIEHAVLQGETWGTIHNAGQAHEVQGWFVLHYTVTGLLCGLGFAGWVLLWLKKDRTSRWFPILALLLPADLLWFGYGRSAQCDPALYYPKIPVLEGIAHSIPGRIIGVRCFAPNVTEGEGLDDIRVYDSIDPARMAALLKCTAMPGLEPRYASTQFLVPAGNISAPGNIRLSPILDMLSVRYVIFNGGPPPDIHPAFQSPGYWVVVNTNALPRVYLPRSVEPVANEQDDLAKLTAPHFDPRETAYVESPITPVTSCRGTAQIVHEIPTRVTISVHMETPGMVVLADRWDKGWRAFYNGRRAPVLLANYAIRGVMVPAGDGTLEFVYEPASLILGFCLAGLALIVIVGWAIAVWKLGRTLQEKGTRKLRATI